MQPRCAWISALVCLLAGECSTACLRAADPSPERDAQSTQTEPAAARSPAAAQQGLLVLKTGRLLSGRIERSGEGYTLLQPNGQLLVPLAEVRFVCRDLLDAYRQYRESIPADSADDHLALSRWCMSHQLLEEARAELRETLVLEPDRSDARSLLVRLDQVLSGDPKSAGVPPAKKSAATGPVEALAGFSPQVSQDFTRKVQPILMNKCGLASCHGPQEKNGLRLERVVPGLRTHRALVEKNLGSVLEYVDIRTPQASRLLSFAQSPHGHRGRTVFAGQRGRAQFQELRQWVFATAKEQGRRDPSQEPAGSPATRREQPAHASFSEGDADGVRAASATAADSQKKKPATPRAVPGRRKAAPSEAPTDSEDAFDPQEFNRKRGRRQ